MEMGRVMLNGTISSANWSSADGAKGTDMPVLLTVAEKARQAALIERREGTYRLNMQPRHAVWVVALFAAACGTAQAATPAGLIGPMVAIF